jgi:ABC-2 type transport system ATP-binding protein
MAPTTALLEVSLKVARGELLVIVGPNGSGKTTLLKILSCLILPTAGQLRVMGFDPIRQADRVKPFVGLVTGDKRSFYWRLSARENLLFFATLYGLKGPERRKRVDELIELLGIEGPERRVEVLSGGMKQRLALARGLLGDPCLLLLDEPLRNLDPPTARNIQGFIRQELVGRRGKTVIYTTHSLPEAVAMADRVAVLNSGRLVAIGCLEEIARQAGHPGSHVEALYLLLSGNGTSKAEPSR